VLINFSVENFRSFNEEQTLNLIASKGLKGHEDHRVNITETGQHVLPIAVIYGANAAGKSNVMKAIKFAQDLIMRGAGPMKRLALDQFRFTEDAAKPSSFEFRFLAGGQIFIYGFDVTPEEVTEEWLSTTNESGREVDVFHRKGSDINFGDMKKFGEEGITSSKVLKALELLGTRPNQLLFNKIVDLDEEKRGGLLSKVVWWFGECLTVIEPDASFAGLTEYINDNQQFREFASEFLLGIGTGIGDLDVKDIEMDANKIPVPLLKLIKNLSESELTPSDVGFGESLRLHPDDSTKIIRRNIDTKHTIAGTSLSLPFDEESDGTQRLLHLLPALYHLKNSCKVFVIDELDRSLHSLLSHAMLKFFLKACPGSCQQLIVTTHETHLLDLNLLRRDEIWFTEKDAQQQTQLFSLADMKPRKDSRVEKGYLQGRFGGVPLFSGIEKLHDLVDCGESQ